MNPLPSLSSTETPKDFVSPHDVLFDSSSLSLKVKYRQALKMITDAAKQLCRGDPVTVSVDTSGFIVTLLYKYTGIDAAVTAEKIKGEDALVGIISGMRWVHKSKTHWALDFE